MQQPSYYDLTMLTTIGQAIDGMAESANDLYASLQAAKTQPTVLDDATVGRLITLYTEQQEDYPLYAEQLRRWLLASPTPPQRASIERLRVVLEQMTLTVKRLLALAHKLSQFTIERVMAMSDEQVGILTMTGGFHIIEETDQ